MRHTPWHISCPQRSFSHDAPSGFVRPHTEDILSEIGYSGDEIDRLGAGRIV